MAAETLGPRSTAAGDGELAEEPDDRPNGAARSSCSVSSAALDHPALEESRRVARLLDHGATRMSVVPIQPWPLLRRLVGDCLRFRFRLALAATSAVTLGAAQLYFTWLIRRWVDGPLARGDRGSLTGILVE